jgi:GNAT superfamily N-acetyltransferase
MIVVTLNEALNILGYDIFTKYIKYMCKETYNMWFDKYYSKHLDIYPTYESLSMVYINLANNIKTNNYYQGYILLNNEDKENNKVIGYVSINFNDFDIFNDERDKNTIWLTDLFIWPEYRSKGYSNILINHVKKISKKINKEIYIACEDKLINFYLNKKWNIINILNKSLNNIWTIMIFNDF